MSDDNGKGKPMTIHQRVRDVFTQNPRTVMTAREVANRLNLDSTSVYGPLNALSQERRLRRMRTTPQSWTLAGPSGADVTVSPPEPPRPSEPPEAPEAPEAPDSEAITQLAHLALRGRIVELESFLSRLLDSMGVPEEAYLALRVGRGIEIAGRLAAHSPDDISPATYR